MRRIAELWKFLRLKRGKCDCAMFRDGRWVECGKPRGHWKRDGMIRRVFWHVRHRRREFEALENNWQEVLKTNQELAALLIEHHSSGALDGVLPGDNCPVCAKRRVTPRLATFPAAERGCP